MLSEMEKMDVQAVQKLLVTKIQMCKKMSLVTKKVQICWLFNEKSICEIAFSCQVYYKTQALFLHFILDFHREYESDEDDSDDNSSDAEDCEN